MCSIVFCSICCRFLGYMDFLHDSTSYFAGLSLFAFFFGFGNYLPSRLGLMLFTGLYAVGVHSRFSPGIVDV